ncbi:hypothetical protein CQW23_03694 [Capsicum baccatum]|uniref:Uncharacterized protein n=1 Tax=Capsicum baccatum TaxID=33114 RepID=A0A2G2XCI7_CAPBA|nr:hypothetical protein CQW23_03694 [Capsicum baccatum]
MGEIIKDEIKTGYIVSFATLKATTQAIQRGLGSVGGKINEEDASAIVVGQRAQSRRPLHRYPLAQAQGHSIEDCHYLKREIEKMIQGESIMVQNIDSGESLSHADVKISG